MMIFYGVFFFVISVHHAYPQSIQTAVRDIGGSIEIKCLVFNANSFPIAWLKFEKEDPTKTAVLSIGKNLFVRNSRFSLEVFIENGTSSHILKIKNIRKTDIALYRCVVMCDDVDGDANTSADIELEVNRPPLILNSSSPTVVIAREGQSSKLECYTDGFPKPRVSWTRQYNGILITGGNYYRGNVLRFLNVTKDDRGTYYCDAVNSVGSHVQHIVDFRVHFAPVLTVSKIMYTHIEPSKQNVDVQCLVEAYPAPKIEWLYNGVVLLNDNYYNRIMEIATEHQFTYSTLNFLKINNDRYGNYTCKARNTIGTAEVTNIELRPCKESNCDTRRVHQERIPSNYYGLNLYGLPPH